MLEIQTCTAILKSKPQLEVFLAYATKRLEEKKKASSSAKYDTMKHLLYDDDEPDNLDGMAVLDR